MRRLGVGVAVMSLAALYLGQTSGLPWTRDEAPVVLPDVGAPPPAPDLTTLRLGMPPLSRDRFEGARARAAALDPSARPRLVELFDPARPDRPSDVGSLRIEYSLDEPLTERVFEILRRGRVARGHVIVADPRSGRLLVYASTDPEALPPERAYPVASIVKILTAAAVLDATPTDEPPRCVYRGNPYRLRAGQLRPPPTGREVTLERALATSNNRCFAQWAFDLLGAESLHETIERFGWLAPPAPGHEPGQLLEVESSLDVGRLGSGLGGLRVTPLHVAQLASILTDGRRIEPWWIDRVADAAGRSLELPPRHEPERVLSPERAAQLRAMLVATTARGTARSAFRGRGGQPLLGGLEVAGKTGNVTGSDPFGRYEWFLGLAPASAPKIAVIVVQLQSNLWWSRSSELAAEILRSVFCEKGVCGADLANRWTGELGSWVTPMLVSDLVRDVVDVDTP